MEGLAEGGGELVPEEGAPFRDTFNPFEDFHLKAQALTVLYVPYSLNCEGGSRLQSGWRLP